MTDHVKVEVEAGVMTITLESTPRQLTSSLFESPIFFSTPKTTSFPT